MTEQIPEDESLRKQLDLVDARMRHHIIRFWSWPMAYISIVFISLSSLQQSGTAIEKNAPVLLIIFGLLVLLAMKAAYAGTARSIEDVVRIEQQLHLIPTPKKKPMQFVPFVLVVLVGIVYSLLCAI